MPFETGSLLTVGAMAVGVIVWLVRLEGRVNLGDSRHADLKAALDEIRADVKELLRK